MSLMFWHNGMLIFFHLICLTVQVIDIFYVFPSGLRML